MAIPGDRYPREWLARKDYQVLTGTNRHTILPSGWVQEENNLKTVLALDRRIDPATPFLAREYGVARYERIKDGDFAAGDDYYTKTRGFWNQVLGSWAMEFNVHPEITLKGQVDELGLYAPLFEYADEVVEGNASKPAGEVIGQAIAAMKP